MTDYKLYPNLPPSAPPENPQVAYHLSVIQAKQRGLKNEEQMFKKKYKKYTKILNWLTWLNACLTKYKHTHTAFVEALNKILAERLFKVQDAQELNDPEKVSSRWVKHLYGLADELNNTETEMIGMKHKDAIKLKDVPLVKQENYLPEEVLPVDGLYQYLLQPGEEHDDQ